MILYDLICGKDHVFEAWFRNGPSFDAQQAAGDITCPVCGSTEVLKARKGAHCARKMEAALSEAGEEQLAHDLIQALERLCRNLDLDEDGEDGSEQPRRPKSDSREIRRKFGPSDRNTLLDEGIEVIRIPWARRRHNS